MERELDPSDERREEPGKAGEGGGYGRESTEAPPGRSQLPSQDTGLGNKALSMWR